MCNFLDRVARSKRKTLAADLKRIFTVLTYEWVKEAATDVAENWRSTHPALADQLEENLEHCLTCFAFPTPHRSRIRTTNGLERLNQEIARRTRVVKIFPNPAACLRLVTALCVEQSEEWLSGKRYLEMSWLDELCDAPETQPEKEVTLIPS